MTAIKVVIGDRLGKGQKVGQGVEAAGGVAVVIPGVAADMTGRCDEERRSQPRDFFLRQRGCGRDYGSNQTRI